jgi:hypothetical protein
MRGTPSAAKSWVLVARSKRSKPECGDGRADAAITTTKTADTQGFERTR